MDRYSANNKYVLSSYLHLIGKLMFALALILLAFSIYYGTPSTQHENATTPNPILLKYSLIIFAVWGVAITLMVLTAIGLSCDCCNVKLYKVPHGYKSTKKRNWLFVFFYPDDVFHKRFTCFNCNTKYVL